MARAAFTLHIKPDRIAEYIEAHRNVWPEMRAALRDSGFRNYSIFRDGTVVFGYFEAEDPAAAFEAMGRTEVNARWQDAMAELLEQRVADAGPAFLEEVFHLE